MLGIGFLVALTVLIRGTPWRTRGSFIKVGSSFAGTKTSERAAFGCFRNLYQERTYLL